MSKPLSYRRLYFTFCLLFLFIGFSACQRYKPCNPEADQSCPQDKVCEQTKPDKSFCLKVCDSQTGDPCARDEACFRYTDNNYACTPTCNPAAPSPCAQGWLCAPGAGEKSVCRPACDINAASCPEGEVCEPLPDGSGTGVCIAQCNPNDAASCGPGRACELRTDGLYMCAEPVFIRGTVFDSSDKKPLAEAHVIAADKTGAAATDVGITDNEGEYDIQVPVMRNPDGTLADGVFTLRVSALYYLPYPYGIRPAIPLDAAKAEHLAEEKKWVLQNAATDVALIFLSSYTTQELEELGSISGSVVVNSDKKPGGVLIAVEGGTKEAQLAFSDKKGAYTVFNVSPGAWQVHGYKAFLQLDPASVTQEKGENKTGINLNENTAKSYGTITGNVNIVNAPGGSVTSVVLVPESTFSATFVKGEVPQGLRAPAPPAPPNISGSFTINGVPDGKYVVLAAFENDKLVRDPDPNISGTQIVHITVPDNSSYNITLPSSFKITEALVIVGPGATEPEKVTETPTFVWKDDSSEIKYSIVVYNAFGQEVWRDDNIPKVTGSENVTVKNDQLILEDGMYYQFRATSWRDAGPISQTEDLLGVFYKEAPAE